MNFQISAVLIHSLFASNTKQYFQYGGVVLMLIKTLLLYLKYNQSAFTLAEKPARLADTVPGPRLYSQPRCITAVSSVPN